MSMGTRDQEYLAETEPHVTETYADIAGRHDLKVTFFVTGRAVEEEPEVFQRLARRDHVELGGHNYYAFQPRWLYNWIFYRTLGLWNGPAFYQNWEIRKTIKQFKKITGVRIRAWRDHAYRHDCNTYHLLANNGIEVVSDEVGPECTGPYLHDDGIVSLPVNVMPDSDHMYHGFFQPETTRGWSLQRSTFPPDMMWPEEWLEQVKRQIESIVKKGGTASLLVHPAPMKIIDNFETFSKLCSFLSKFQSEKVSEVAHHVG
jgi:hypothetical protein